MSRTSRVASSNGSKVFALQYQQEDDKVEVRSTERREGAILYRENQRCERMGDGREGRRTLMENQAA